MYKHKYERENKSYMMWEFAAACLAYMGGHEDAARCTPFPRGTFWEWSLHTKTSTWLDHCPYGESRGLHFCTPVWTWTSCDETSLVSNPERSGAVHVTWQHMCCVWPKVTHGECSLGHSCQPGMLYMNCYMIKGSRETDMPSSQFQCHSVVGWEDCWEVGLQVAYLGIFLWLVI